MEKSHIFIVDDNPVNLELAGDLLEMESFQVTLIDNGFEAIAEARKTLPDLILMDLRMPGMSGLEAQRALYSCESTRDIPVVVVTASVMTGEKERLLSEGFDGFMQKPISVATFANEVRAFLK